MKQLANVYVVPNSTGNPEFFPLEKATSKENSFYQTAHEDHVGSR